MKIKFDFSFPSDNLMVTTVLLDIKISKFYEIDKPLNLLDGSLTRREFLSKLVKISVLETLRL